MAVDLGGWSGVAGNGLCSMAEKTTWSSATAGIQLSSNEVHIWRACLDVDSSVRKRLSAVLSTAEQERDARFAFARDRNRFAVARAILRQLLGLGGYLGEPPGNVVLETRAHGKPILRLHGENS
jgi:4'-phosphopantetheinyl transferase